MGCEEAECLPRVTQLRGLEPRSASMQNPLCTLYHCVCLPAGVAAVKGVPEHCGEGAGYQPLILLSLAIPVLKEVAQERW